MSIIDSDYENIILLEHISLELNNILYYTFHLKLDKDPNPKCFIHYNLSKEFSKCSYIKEKNIAYRLERINYKKLIFTIFSSTGVVLKQTTYVCESYRDASTELFGTLSTMFLDYVFTDGHVEDNTTEPSVVSLDNSFLKEIYSIETVGTSTKYNVVFKDMSNHFVISDTDIGAKPGDYVYMSETRQISFLPKHSLQ